MTDIVLVPVTGGSNISAMNNNFSKIAVAVNNQILHLTGGNNTMRQDLDMNGNDLLNINTDVNNPGSILTVGAGDVRYYNVTGDTLTGQMNANGQHIVNLAAPVTANEPVRKGDYDAKTSIQDGLIASNELQSVRAPEGESITALPPASTRANKLASFDGLGNPIAVAAANQSATDLEIRLADQIDPTKGAKMVGWLQETGEPGNTSDELRKAIRTSQFTQNAAGLQKAVNLALAKGRPLEVDSSFNCLGTTINIATPLTIVGHGTLTNCILKLGVAGVRVDWFKRLSGFTLSGATSKILIHSGRHIRIACNFSGCTNGIHGQVVVGTSGFHDIGYIDYTGSTFVACTKDVFLENATPTVLVFNDFQATDFVSSFASQYHMHAQQLDGLNIGSHVILMERNKPTKNGWYIQNSEWLNFTGAANIFECGEEGILLEEVGSINIGGAMSVVFVGQQAIKSAIKIVNTAKFASINISGVKGEKPSGNVIDISSATGWTGLVSNNGGTVDLRTGSGANQTYFGAAPLNSVPHYLVKTDSIATRALVTDNQGTLIDGGGLSTLLEMLVPGSFIDPHHAVQHTGYDCFKRTVAVAGPSVTIMRLEDTEGSQITFGGIITMVAKNAAGTKSATYQLSVNGLSITLIAETGLTTGAAADEPSFSWAVSASKTLQASRKNLTSGTFDFYATCVGDVRLRV